MIALQYVNKPPFSPFEFAYVNLMSECPSKLILIASQCHVSFAVGLMRFSLPLVAVVNISC